MKTKMAKTELLRVLIKNRITHRQIFNEAVEGYRAEVIEILDDKIKRLKGKEKISLYISLPEPEDHTEDYDRIIGMVESSVDSVVELSEQEFSWYVKDKWDWKDRWAETTASYMSR